MKILHLSDTHNLHRELKTLPEADILVHSGDFTSTGSQEEAIEFMNWFCDLPYRHKIFIAGNHDDCLLDAQVEGLPENVHLLNHAGIVIEGLKIYGMPMFLEYDLFGEESGYIAAIPQDADIVVTHQPPLNILDYSEEIHYGNRRLREKILQLKPRCHLFGHIHNDYGIIRENGILFSNAALVDENYELAHDPRLLELTNPG